MGTKLDPGKYDCEAAAEPDEPKFTLLARDPDAARLVRLWAWGRLAFIERGAKPKSDLDKVNEARLLADKMDEWYKRNRG